MQHQLKLFPANTRKTNRSFTFRPEGGSCAIDSRPYLRELGIEIQDKKKRVQFTHNFSYPVHRWVPYVQGFSAEFVQSVLDRYRDDYHDPVVLDPFAGCGTVLVQSKLTGHESVGTELNPFLHYIANIKVNSWDVKPEFLIELYSSIPRNIATPSPAFLKSHSQFNLGVLKNLEILKGGIDSIDSHSSKVRKAKDLLLLAFASILVDCSNLKRTPCLGYSKNKKVPDSAPWVLIDKKIREIAGDLVSLNKQHRHRRKIGSQVILANAMEYVHHRKFDLIITSPPYMNGLDYVMNYKIEMAWLNFIKNNKDAKKIKDEMVVCDNVSKGLIKNFADSGDRYTNQWLRDIVNRIARNLAARKVYRRLDMPSIVAKYFDDMYRVMKNVSRSLKPNGRFVLVVGDSLVADVYLPTDLLLAKIGTEPEIGLAIEKIEKARTRRSGQVRNYLLRETIVTLKKPPKAGHDG